LKSCYFYHYRISLFLRIVSEALQWTTDDKRSERNSVRCFYSTRRLDIKSSRNKLVILTEDLTENAGWKHRCALNSGVEYNSGEVHNWHATNASVTHHDERLVVLANWLRTLDWWRMYPNENQPRSKRLVQRVDWGKWGMTRIRVHADWSFVADAWLLN